MPSCTAILGFEKNTAGFPRRLERPGVRPSKLRVETCRRTVARAIHSRVSGDPLGESETALAFDEQCEELADKG